MRLPSGTFLFALLACPLALAAVADVWLHGRLTVVDPRLLAGIAVLGIGVLLFGFIRMRSRASDLSGRTDRLTKLTAELEQTVAALEATNARLNASEARYKGLVDAQGDAVLRRMADGRLSYANESFYRLFGLSPQHAVGRVFQPEMHPDSPPPVFGKLAGREVGYEGVRYDQHVRTVIGFRWIAWEDYAIRDEAGRLVEIQSIGRDITERKALEAELSAARDKAEDANRAKSYFLATMSHEIRTPMNGVLGMARLLLDTPLSPQQASYADAIRQCGFSLLALIEDILDFSKIESGTLKLDVQDTALRPLIEGVNELLSPRASIKGLDLVAAVAPEVPAIIKADAVRLRQVLTNLVGNAIKFTESGGVLVTVEVEQRGGGRVPTLCLSVRDTGIGIPKEKRAQVFEDFVQVDPSHARRFEGTGLGLAITRRLVEAMGGKIGTVPAADKGSVFWVTLPLHAGKAGELDTAKPISGKRIALIAPSTILGTGLRMQVAAAGGEAVELRSWQSFAASTKPFDAILADGGAEFDPILAASRGPLPIVALLWPEDRARLAKLRDHGVAHYLMKPARQASLERRLGAALAGEAPVDDAALMPASSRAKVAVRPLDILLAEDNAVNAMLARELLKRRGHNVREVTSGDAAVAACARQRFDVVLMDLHMPGLDGISATTRIRTLEASVQVRRTPIYALTADALDTGRQACLEAGMDGFLTKPVDPDELDAVLASLGSTAQQTAA